LAVNVDEVATPLALVVSVSVLFPLAVNTPLAPEAGAVKVTDAPLVGDPSVVTVACSFVGNGWLICALCVVPPDGVIVITGKGGVVEFELPQPVMKVMARNTTARMPA
jgi:hypothetical protein